MTTDKKAQVQAFFTQHAAAYSVSTSHRKGSDLDMLIQALALQSHYQALDVATATGHTAHAVAPHVANVVGLDLTPAMQPQFERDAAERGVTNVRFQVGDAEALPFPPDHFDIVTARRATHHFPNINQALAEIARVLRPGGRFGLSDMMAPADPAGARLMNDLEIARDGSHVRAYSEPEWRDLVATAGLQIVSVQIQAEDYTWPQWLYPVAPDGPEAEAAEAVYLAAAADVRLHTATDDPAPASRTFHKRRIVLVAEKPA